MWFVYDPGDPEFELYQTEEDAKTEFAAIVERYRTEATLDNEWDEDVAGVCMGRVTHRVDLVDVTAAVLPDLIESEDATEGDTFAEAFVREV